MTSSSSSVPSSSDSIIRLNVGGTSNVDINALKHEAEFYGIGPLVKRLMLCDELDQCECGDVLFHGFLPAPPQPPILDHSISCASGSGLNRLGTHSRNLSEPIIPSTIPPPQQNPIRALPTMDAKFQACATSSIPMPNEIVAGAGAAGQFVNVSGNSGAQGQIATVPAVHGSRPKCHMRTNSADLKSKHPNGSRNGKNSADLARQIRQDLSAAMKIQYVYTDPFRARIIRAHHNWVAVAYGQYFSCYKMRDSMGWHLVHVSERLDSVITHLAFNAKGGQQSTERMVAVALMNHKIHLWSLTEEGAETRIGVFTLGDPVSAVNTLFFIGSQLVALSKRGIVGIWHAMTQNWQTQPIVPISSYDTAGSFLLLGGDNGSIYYIDMQKFPLRMKDNEFLVTELYRDPEGEKITSISVYLTPKTSLCGNWIEIAYGTSGGTIRVIVQHPETVGHGPQLFQTFTVHRQAITRVALTTNHLISVCEEYNHVRTWTVTRFRGMISTQPGSTPLASFKVMTLESADFGLDADSTDAGPFGDQDGEQVFVQKIVPDTSQLYVRLASNGDRVCLIKSVDGSSISSFLVHECEGSNRISSRSRRYLFTGHSNGCIQMWDLTTALDMYHSNRDQFRGAKYPQGPTPNELLRLIDECEVTCNSLGTTPTTTPMGSNLTLASTRQNSDDKQLKETDF